MELAKVQKLELPAGRRVLAVSDIHGNLDFFQALLRQVGFCRNDILIILGDVLEKGEAYFAEKKAAKEAEKAAEQA